MEIVFSVVLIIGLGVFIVRGIIAIVQSIREYKEKKSEVKNKEEEE